MATKALYTQGNPFELLQEAAGQGERQKTANNKPVVGGAAQLTPAEKAQRRAAAQTEKAAAQEVARKKQEAEAALALMAGPQEGFITQTKAREKKKEDVGKKMSREAYEKSGGVPAQKSETEGQRPPRKEKPEGDKPSFEGQGKPTARTGGERTKFQGERGERGPKGPRSIQGEGEGGQRLRHDGLDKHSAGKTSRKFQNKRQGGGQGNWGNPVEPVTSGVATEGWEGESEKTQATTTAEGEKAEGEKAEGEKEVAPADERPRKEGPDWDDEGFGKMTLAEYKAKVEAARQAELAAKVGVAEPRKIEGVDLSKFSYKDDEIDEPLGKKSAGQKLGEKKAKQQRANYKPVELNEVFAVRGGGGRGRGGRGPRPDGQARGGDGSRGGRGGHNRVPGIRQFPELVPQKTAPQPKA